ncbi:MAG: hypothetical protein MSL09_02180 [Spirochaetia bacterium]|nr:hypothetical protein [Spirochaetia bacterium]
MKKLFVLLGVFCALCFVACSNFQLAGGDMGVVSLSIGDNLVREIRSAAASRNVADGTYTLTASIRGEYSDSQTVAVADGNYSGVTFTFEDVPVGKRIILDLTAKADGNYIWYGNSGKHMVVSGINNLNVAVGRVSGVLLWKLENHNILTAPYGAYDSPAEREITFGASDSSQGRAFCFDSDGNLYVMPSDGFTVKKYDLQLDGTYEDRKTDISTNGQVFNHLAYDSVADVLYGIGENDVLKCFKTNSQGFDQVPSDTVNSGSYLGLAAHDNVVYTIEPGGEDLNAVHYATVKSYSISIEGSDAGDTAQPTLKVVKENSFLLPSFCTSNYTYQMIYHEGALYLLLRRFEINDASNASVDNPVEHYSLGALAKIDPNTLTLDTSFGNGGYLGLSSSPVTFNDRKDSGKTFNVTYHGSTAGNDTFFGPVGFVAVMPKKLVIGDAGFAMSADGADTVSLTKKSRIVTVDLETLAFDATDIDTSYYQSDDNYSSISSKVSGYSYIVIANN